MAHKISFSSSPIDQLEAELGRRIEAARLSANISQAELAAAAGVSRRTITRLENGGGVSLDTLIRVLRALKLSGRLEALLPEPGVQPIDRVRLRRDRRRRARPGARPAASEWTWADDRSKGTTDERAGNTVDDEADQP